MPAWWLPISPSEQRLLPNGVGKLLMLKSQMKRPAVQMLNSAMEGDDVA